MPTIHLTITDTPHGVVVHAAGELHALSGAGWVARSMVEFVQPIFADGNPVLLGGLADPVQPPTQGPTL